MQSDHTPLVFVLFLANTVHILERQDKLFAESDRFRRLSTPQSTGQFKGVYPFLVRAVEQWPCSSMEATTLIQQRIPVVLKGCTFARSALKWNISYLQQNLRDRGHPVLISPSRRFPYFNPKKIRGKYLHWKPPADYHLTSVEEFVGIVKEIEKEDNGSHAYFQSLLYLNNDVGKQIHDDVMSFNFSWLLGMATRMAWKRGMSNLLLIGMKNVVTPAHYDLLENIYLQIQGAKRWMLFSPDSYTHLYPYPVDHPHDRQSQVNFDDPDYSSFPEFKSLHGQEVVLQAGDVLYIPIYWWHYVETSIDSLSVSLNFWFEPNKTKDASTPSAVPLKEKQFLSPEGKLLLHRETDFVKTERKAV